MKPAASFVTGAGVATRAALALLAASAAVLVAAPAGAAEGGVLHLPADKMTAAFVKGESVAARENYKVSANRRDAAGQPEVHEKDTDVFHVVSGTATFVTGGTVVGGKATAPEEIRGTSIEGGEARTLRAGDVIVVPRGTPHWFKEVPGPVTYLVIKVRAPETGSR
jgi:glc operon protein GlcG